jgi:hypothetical protein
MDHELVAGVAAWFAGREAMWRGSGAVGPRASGGSGPQSDLLTGFGRSSQWGPGISIR